VIEAHFLSTDEHVFTAEERRTVAELVDATEPGLRAALSGLPGRVNLVVATGTEVIEETGEVGFTSSPTTIQWTIDPRRGVVDVAVEHLRHMLFHEAHHAARLVRFPSLYAEDWYAGSVLEGLATAFERSEGGFDPPWGQYPPGEIEDWAEELLRQPIDHTFGQWKFLHPDGRRWIAYRVGTWIVDQAVAATGRSAADMVWDPVEDIVRAAGLSYTPVRP
jgi:uncharacterized protein YjaZ